MAPPATLAERTAWWQKWVDFVRNSPGLVDDEGTETLYYGEHLFIGCQSHHQLFRTPRAVGRQAPMFSDVLEYQEVSDLRAWGKTQPATLMLHEKILAEHCYIVGPSGSGKSSLGIMPLLIQLMQGAKTENDERTPPYPVVILDLKGDSALFHTVKTEAKRRGQVFQFFRTEKHEPTFRFNPFRGFDRGSRSVAQLCQLILDALNLNHGKGYGRSYYTERSRNVLSRTLKRNRNIQSFDELHAELRETVNRADVRTKGDAFELISVIEMLTEYRQLITDPDETISNTDGIIFMPTVLADRQVAYFWLPAALESISVGEIAKLVLFNLRVAAQDWKRSNPDKPRSVILVIDELQRVAGENLQGILQDARSFGIHAILANQSLSDLKSQTGFDLAPTIMTNTRVKFFFTSPSEHQCYVYVERGKGFTKARQFPQKGNPWLKDLSPEEFAYHVELAWPFSEEEYQAREAEPLPSWEEIPGGNFYREEIFDAPEDEFKTLPDGPLPRDFKIFRDEEWEKQVAAIHAIFAEEDGDEPSIGPLLTDGQEVTLAPGDVQKMRQEILTTIPDRATDRSRCLTNLMFENHLNGVKETPTWQALWAHCWREPLNLRDSAEVIRCSGIVRQTVSRLRDIFESFFEESTGRKWRVRASIQLDEYRLIFETNLRDSDVGSGPPMLGEDEPELEEE